MKNFIEKYRDTIKNILLLIFFGFIFIVFKLGLVLGLRLPEFWAHLITWTLAIICARYLLKKQKSNY